MMNVTPLLRSKLLLPELPSRFLFSRRIKDINIPDKRLAILVAPAGFGKTTSVLLALENYRQNIRWYRMEREDAFLPVFYSHLLETLFAGQTEKGKDSFHLLHSIQDYEQDYLILNAQICQDLCALTQNHRSRLYLVLDDFHHAQTQPAIQDTIRYFCGSFPEQLSIILTSRLDPEIMNHQFQLRPDCRQITAESLLFNPEEIRAFLCEICDLQISEKQLDYYYRLTDGWVGGLNIICHNMELIKNGAGKSELPTGGYERFIENDFAILMRESLRDMDEGFVSDLLRVSMLDDFSLQDLKSLFQFPDAEGFLSRLEKSCLSFQKTSVAPARYSLHSLLRQELNKLYMERHSLDDQKRLFEKIGAYYLSMADLPLAIRHYLLAQKEEKACQLAMEAGKDFFISGQPEKMFRLLNEFSEEQIAGNPYLLLFSGMMLINTEREASRNRFIHAMRQFRMLKDYSFLMNSLGMMLVVAYQTNDFQLLEDAAKQIPVLPMLFAGRTVFHKLLISLFMALTGEDKLRLAQPLHAFLKRLGILDDMWHFSYLMIQGIYHYRRGELREAEEMRWQILAHPIGLANDQWRIIALVSCCNTNFLLRNLEGLSEFAQAFFLLGERYNSDFALGYGQLSAAHFHYQKGHYPEALATIRLSAATYRRYQGEVLARESELIEMIWEEEDKAAERLEQAREYYRYFQREKPGHGVREFAELLFGVLCKRLQNWPESERHLLRSLRVSEQKGARQNVCGVMFQLADLYYLRDDRGRGDDYLRKAGREALERGYFYFRELDDASRKRLQKMAKERRLAEDYFAAWAKLTPAPLSESLCQNAGSGRIELRLLGHFSIKGSQFELVEKDFKTRKVSGILKYILISAPGRSVSREQLASVFWPEVDSKAAFTSLRVALYELRKTLSRCGLAPEDENALIVEHKDGFRLRRPESLDRDTERFEALYQNWKKLSPDQEERWRLLPEICDLYRGEFLENSYYDDWVTVQREYYSSMYFDCLHELGRSAPARKEFQIGEQQLLRALRIDPQDETSLSLLLDLYRAMGEDDRAAILQKKFDRRLRKPLAEH